MAIANVSFDQLKISVGKMRFDVGTLSRRIIKIVEVDNNRHPPIVFSHQAIDKVRPNETRAAGDENALHALYPLECGGLTPLWHKRMRDKIFESAVKPAQSKSLLPINPQMPTP